jgi:lysophospholipase L1-like esterase
LGVYKVSQALLVIPYHYHFAFTGCFDNHFRKQCYRAFYICAFLVKAIAIGKMTKVEKYSKSMHARPLIWVIYLVVVTIVIMAVVEGAVRLLHIAPPLLAEYTAYVDDPYLPHKTRPLSRITGRNATDEFSYDYRHNSFGFRDVEHQREKPKGVFRILGLGDSFTYGVGATFEESYLYRLEEMLNNRGGGHPQIEIIKAGIPRFWPEPERLLLQHYGAQFLPNLVMVAFLPNDVIDTFEGMHAVRVTKDGFLRTREAEQLGEFGAWFYIHSHAARIFLRHYVASRIEKSHPASRPADVYKPDGYHEKDWRNIETEFDKMIALARQMSANIVFIHIPQMAPWDETASYPANRLAAWCERRDVPFIDVLPAMREAAKKHKIYYEKDGHCNSDGYHAIAEAIYAGLLNKKLVP